uniref:Uncharacterized protein n=1 Tax=Rousettus aegyptiacus TaxID=9407 RepID=A0A7J8CIF2_ROUAE|nr:hypothetical protein HJG63_009137 [Rousettus aegyptiacus]
MRSAPLSGLSRSRGDVDVLSSHQRLYLQELEGVTGHVSVKVSGTLKGVNQHWPLALIRKKRIRLPRENRRRCPTCGHPHTPEIKVSLGPGRASPGHACSHSTWSFGEVRGWDSASVPDAEFQEAGGVINFIPVARRCCCFVQSPEIVSAGV